MPVLVQWLMVGAQREAHGAGATAVEPIHLLIALCKQDDGIAKVLTRFGVDPVRLRRRVRGLAHAVGGDKERSPLRVSRRVRRIVRLAQRAVEDLPTGLTSEVLLATLLDNPDPYVKHVIDFERLPVARLVKALREAGAPAHEVVPFPARRSNPVADQIPMLSRYGRDVAALADGGQLDVGHAWEDEVGQLEGLLRDQGPTNLLLVARDDVVLSTVLRALAQRVATDGSEVGLEDLRIVELVVPAVCMGTAGEVRERFDRLLAELADFDRAILFVDSLHEVLGGGGHLGAELGPALSRALGEETIRFIGGTNEAELRATLQGHPALSRSRVVHVAEPSPGRTRALLGRLRHTYEAHHGVEILEEALTAAVDLSVRYLPDRRLPAKARDLIDQVAVHRRLQALDSEGGAVRPVSALDVAHVVSEWTGVPVEHLTTPWDTHLSRLPAVLRQRLVGPCEVVDSLGRALGEARGGPGRPVAAVVLAGPPGVGKTALVELVATELYGSSTHFLLVDATVPADEAMDELVEGLRRMPHALVCVRADRASAELRLAVAQLIRGGSFGVSVDDAVVVLLLDLATEAQEASSHLAEVLGSDLHGEVDAVVVMPAMSAEGRCVAVRSGLEGVSARLAAKGVSLVVDELAVHALAQLAGRIDVFGKSVDRTLERWVVRPVARQLLEAGLSAGSEVHVVLVPQGVAIAHAPEAGALDPRVMFRSPSSDATTGTTWMRISVPGGLEAVLAAHALLRCGEPDQLGYLERMEHGFVAAFADADAAARVALALVGEIGDVGVALDGSGSGQGSDAGPGVHMTDEVYRQLSPTVAERWRGTSSGGWGPA